MMEDEISVLKSQLVEYEEKLRRAGQLGGDLLQQYSEAVAQRDQLASEHACEKEVCSSQSKHFITYMYPAGYTGVVFSSIGTTAREIRAAAQAGAENLQ